MYDDFKNDTLRQWPMNRDYFETVELHRKEHTAQVRIDKRQLLNVARISRFDEAYDHARDQLVLTMRAAIYGKNHPERHVFRYPETWWEAVKERFAPAWFRDRYPVRFLEVAVSLEETYPDFEPAVPDKTPVVRLHILKSIEAPIW